MAEHIDTDCNWRKEVAVAVAERADADCSWRSQWGACKEMAARAVGAVGADNDGAGPLDLSGKDGDAQKALTKASSHCAGGDCSCLHLSQLNGIEDEID